MTAAGQQMCDWQRVYAWNPGQAVPPTNVSPFDVATLELSEHFGQVQLHRYHNTLVVTDAEAFGRLIRRRALLAQAARRGRDSLLHWLHACFASARRDQYSDRGRGAF